MLTFANIVYICCHTRFYSVDKCQGCGECPTGIYYLYKYPWWNRRATRKPGKTGTGMTYSGCFRAFLLLKKMKPAGLKTEKGKQAMTPKQQLIDNLNGYKNIYEKIQEEKNRIDKNAVYTDAGKEQQLQLLLGKYEPIIKRYHDTACEIIDQGVEKLNEKWTQLFRNGLPIQDIR